MDETSVREAISCNICRLAYAMGWDPHFCDVNPVVSSQVRKADATGWGTFLGELYEEFDQSLRRQAEALVGHSPVVMASR